MQGMIEGGWEFVWAAYGISWFVIIAYVFSLWKRSSHEQS